MTIINEVIKGISSKLHKLTKYPVYVDVKKNHVVFPCFYLKQLDQSQELSVGNRYWQEHRFSPAFSCIQATIMKELQPCCEFGRKSRGFKYIKNV